MQKGIGGGKLHKLKYGMSGYFPRALRLQPSSYPYLLLIKSKLSLLLNDKVICCGHHFVYSAKHGNELLLYSFYQIH